MAVDRPVVLAEAELDALLEIALRSHPGPKPWLAETGAYRLLVPQWDGRFTPERVEVPGRAAGPAVREHAARFGAQPTFDFAWGALTGAAPWRFPLPLEPHMDELKDRCDRGQLLVGVAGAEAPRTWRFAAFDEVYEVTLELHDGKRVPWPWRDFARSVELLCSLTAP